MTYSEVTDNGRSSDNFYQTVLMLYIVDQSTLNILVDSSTNCMRDTDGPFGKYVSLAYWLIQKRLNNELSVIWDKDHAVFNTPVSLQP